MKNRKFLFLRMANHGFHHPFVKKISPSILGKPEPLSLQIALKLVSDVKKWN